MTYKVSIHKRKIYIKPRPKIDIPGGLIIILNKPREEKKEPFLVANIEAFKNEYDLPSLPEGVWIIQAFVKNEIRINGGKDKI